MRYKVLLIDDDEDNLTSLGAILGRDGFSVVLAHSASEAYLAAVDSRPDLILSDVAMPGTDGVSLTRQLKSDRRTRAIPVILMSGLYRAETDQTDGIDQGAEDYLPKPVSKALLVAKIRAVLRRFSPAGEMAMALGREGLTVNLQARTAVLQGQRVPLTRKEFDLLTTFLAKPGRVMSIPYLLETVWGYDPASYNNPRTVVVHVSSLRRKLGAKLGRRIVSLPGLGYRFES